MKLKAKQPVKNLNGKSLENEGKVVTVGECLANILMAAEVGGKAKMYTMGVDLYKGKDLEIDSTDMTLLKNAVEASKIYTTLVLGQLMILLEDIEKGKK